MKVKYSIDEQESRALRKALKDFPMDMCSYVGCPEGEDCPCEGCPMLKINRALADGRAKALAIIEQMEK